jgi:hypothetical protein
MERHCLRAEDRFENPSNRYRDEYDDRYERNYQRTYDGDKERDYERERQRERDYQRNRERRDYDDYHSDYSGMKDNFQLKNEMSFQPKYESQSIKKEDDITNYSSTNEEILSNLSRINTLFTDSLQK